MGFYDQLPGRNQALANSRNVGIGAATMFSPAAGAQAALLGIQQSEMARQAQQSRLQQLQDQASATRQAFGQFNAMKGLQRRQNAFDRTMQADALTAQLRDRALQNQGLLGVADTEGRYANLAEQTRAQAAIRQAMIDAGASRDVEKIRGRSGRDIANIQGLTARDVEGIRGNYDLQGRRLDNRSAEEQTMMQAMAALGAADISGRYGLEGNKIDAQARKEIADVMASSASDTTKMQVVGDILTNQNTNRTQLKLEDKRGGNTLNAIELQGGINSQLVEQELQGAIQRDKLGYASERDKALIDNFGRYQVARVQNEPYLARTKEDARQFDATLPLEQRQIEAEIAARVRQGDIADRQALLGERTFRADNELTRAQIMLDELNSQAAALLQSGDQGAAQEVLQRRDMILNNLPDNSNQPNYGPSGPGGTFYKEPGSIYSPTPKMDSNFGAGGGASRGQVSNGASRGNASTGAARAPVGNPFIPNAIEAIPGAVANSVGNIPFMPWSYGTGEKATPPPEFFDPGVPAPAAGPLLSLSFGQGQQADPSLPSSLSPEEFFARRDRWRDPNATGLQALMNEMGYPEYLASKPQTPGWDYLRYRQEASQERDRALRELRKRNEQWLRSRRGR